MGDPLYHCPDCENGFRGYHRCSDGTDRVAYTCSDCQKVVYRTVGGLDIEGYHHSDAGVARSTRWRPTGVVGDD
jgi:hypothetical protein